MEKQINPQYVVGLGEVLWDLLPQGRQIGGAPANFAYHVRHYGLPVRVVSAVGDDQLGREIQQLFSQRQIPAVIPAVQYPTGTVQVTLDASGIPAYDICTGVAWDHIPFTPTLQCLAPQTRAVCFGSLAQRSEESRTTIARFLDAMPEAPGILKVFDVNLRQHFYSAELLVASFRRANVLKINDEELDVIRCLLGYVESSSRDLANRLLTDYPLNMVILTCGEKGSYIFTSDTVSYQPAPQIQVADTVGAGDAFTAAFVASYLQQGSLTEAHCQAAKLSAWVCTQTGAMPEYRADGHL